MELKQTTCLVALSLVVTGCCRASTVKEVDTSTYLGTDQSTDSATDFGSELTTDPSSDLATDAPPECQDRERRCEGRFIQSCEGGVWVNDEECDSVDDCISAEDDCRLCTEDPCGFIEVKCLNCGWYPTCDPTCIRAALDMNMLAESCSVQWDWNDVPGELGVTRGCKVIVLQLTTTSDEVESLWPARGCEGDDGVFFSESPNPEDVTYDRPLNLCDKIQLCPNTCEMVRARTYQSVQFSFGCEAFACGP